MNNGWVKLHRKVLDNEVFRHDRTAWHVFETLLLIVNKETGKWSGGSYQLAELTGINKPTLYKAIQRLEKAEMINRVVNTQYTVYYIGGWSDYQANGKRKVNAKETQSNTLTRIENKNTLYNKVSNPVLLETLKDYEAHRQKLKRPMSDKAKQLLISKLEKLYPDNTDKQIQALNQSIENGWLSVFEIKESTSAIKEYN